MASSTSHRSVAYQIDSLLLLSHSDSGCNLSQNIDSVHLFAYHNVTTVVKHTKPEKMGCHKQETQFSCTRRNWRFTGASSNSFIKLQWTSCSAISLAWRALFFAWWSVNFIRGYIAQCEKSIKTMTILKNMPRSRQFRSVSAKMA